MTFEEQLEVVVCLAEGMRLTTEGRTAIQAVLDDRQRLRDAEEARWKAPDPNLKR